MRRIALRQWIDPDGVFAGEVTKYHLVGNWKHQSVAAVAAPGARVLAYPGTPLVAPRRCVAGLARRLAFPADRVHVHTAANQPSEQRNFFVSGQALGLRFSDGRFGQRRLPPLDPMGIEQRGEAIVLRLQHRELIPLGHAGSISAASSCTYFP